MWSADGEAMDRRAAHRRPSVRPPASVGGHDWDRRKDMHYDSLPYPSPSEMIHRAPEVDDFDDDDTTASSSSSRNDLPPRRYQQYRQSTRRSKSTMPPATSRATADPPVPYKRGTFATTAEHDDEPLPVTKTRAIVRKRSTVGTRESSPARRKKDPSPVRKKVASTKSSKSAKYKYQSASESKSSSSSASSSSESDTEEEDDDAGDRLVIEEVTTESESEDDDDSTDSSDDDDKTKKIVATRSLKGKSKSSSKNTKIVHHSQWKKVPRRQISIEEVHTPSGKSSAGSRSSYVRSRELDLALARPTKSGPSRRASPDSVKRAERPERPERPERLERPEKGRALKRSDTELVFPPPKPTLRRAQTTATAAGSQVTASSSAASSAKRPRNVFSGLFTAPDPPPAPDAGPEMTAMVTRHRTPVQTGGGGSGVECIFCSEDYPTPKTAKLQCGHRVCHGCLKRLFKLSLSDPQYMPPKCCTSDIIPLKHVEGLFDDSFKRTWNRKLLEFSTRHRLYCPSKKCNEWIKPANIHWEEGRRVGRCARCRTKVCGSCSGRWHSSGECPREDAKRYMERQEEGWQRCYRCKAMVELEEDCNHMNCRCGAEFCMICGSKWGSCECPWFEHNAVANDRVKHLRAAMTEPENGMFDLDIVPVTRDVRPQVPAPPARNDDNRMLRRFQDRQDRQPDRPDESLVRRLAAIDVDDGYGEEYAEEDEYMYGAGGEENMLGIGGGPSGHYMSDEYRRRPQSFVVPTPPSPPPAVSHHHGHPHSLYAHAPPAPSPFHPAPPPTSHPSHMSHGHANPLAHNPLAPNPLAPNPLAPHSTHNPLAPHSAHNPLAPHSAHNPLAPHSAHNPLAPHPTHNPLAPHSTHNPLGPLPTHNPLASHSVHTSHGPHTPPASAFDRPGGDYITGVSRARGVKDAINQRLADRFSENRQNSGATGAATVQHHAPSVIMSHVSVPMTVPMSAPMSMPPMTHMSSHMAPPPPPAPMMSAPPAPGPPGAGIRRHSLEDDLYVPFGGGPMMRRASVPNHPRQESEAEATTAAMRRRLDGTRSNISPFDEAPRTSSLAGLNSGRGMHRVFEWRNHVEPGVPDGEDTPVLR